MFGHVPSKIDKTEFATPEKLVVRGPYNKYIMFVTS